MTPYGVLATGFVLVVVAMLAVQLLAVAGREPFRPFGEAVHVTLLGSVGRWVVLLCWLWIGFHFLAR